MKIFISGGLGYVGGRLSKYLAEQGHEVVALSRQADSLPLFDKPSTLTILHPEVVMQQPALLQDADAFIHLAALNENDCVKQPVRAIDVNITQTLQWLDLVHQAGIKKFVYFSTAHVYGKPLNGYYDELTLAQPVHPYAITHKCAEDYVLAYTAEKNMCNFVIRLTNSFGGPAFPTADRWTLLVNDLCRMAVEESKMSLLSDGLQYRDFICLEDVCRAIDHLVNKVDMPEGIFNLSAGKSLTVWDMALLVKTEAEKILKRPIQLTRKEPQSDDTNPSTLTISNEKLLNTGFTINNPLTDEITSTLNYFLRNRN